MKYNELIHFDPIVSVKVLRDANDFDRARDDVATYVISNRMRDTIEKILVPNLRFDQPGDSKGLMVVATYGTGKTHLMSVVSAVAEHADLAEFLTDAAVKDAVAPVAGKFRVIRHEIGMTKMGLRDIVCGELERSLADIGVKFSFPSASQVSGTKNSLVEMMQAFEAVEPEKGLLFVVDELLDYLRSKRDTELILDLVFLREIGEICRDTRFRFIAGVQESLFDNPRFSNVANEIRRVKDRYDQLRISREDISYVVQERLLRKTVPQKDLIREHLQPFTSAFEGMSERLEEFVNLFPVHPAYLRTFERITLVEKRKILTTLSSEMRELLDSEVPSGEPGLICFDSYRNDLKDDPANRTIPEVQEVLDRSDVLRNRVGRAMTTPAYIPTALRIVDALTVHRLTTEDIYSPIGMTVEEMRDDLCLLPEGVPELDAAFIGASIDTIVDEIIRSVSGQFISENTDNHQVYLDVRKDIDYDQKIEERAESLDKTKLDEAYFAALEEVLEQRDTPYVSGYRIWQYELPWAAKNVTRIGYLFMGAPNERSTAQPPRDFYIYFLQPYDPPTFDDENKPDEVFFRLESPDEAFTTALRRYAGASALGNESTVTNKDVYDEKRRLALTEMVGWLKANMGHALTVTHKGRTEPLSVWLGAAQGARATLKDQIDTIAAAALTDQFDARYPRYPAFGVAISQVNTGETVKQAIGQIVSRRPSALGGQVLAALQLVDLDGTLIASGEYAADLVERLKAADGKAVNRTAIFVERDPGLATWGTWHLEPAWLAVVAAALCQLGRLEIGFAGGQIDALGLDKLTRMSVDELEAISHLAPPKPTPVAQLREIAGILGLTSGTISANGADEAAVKQLLTASQAMSGVTAQAHADVADGVQLWGALVVDRQAERIARLEALLHLLDDVRARDSVGKMNKVNLTPEAMSSAQAGKEELRWVESALAVRTHLAATVDYLRQADDIFGPADPLEDDAMALRGEMTAIFQSELPIDPASVTAMKQRAEALKKRYVAEAARAHARDRLDAPSDARKAQMLEGPIYRDLKALSTIRLLPAGAFATLERKLIEIASCKAFDERELEKSVVCEHCGYRPRISANGQTARARLAEIDEQLALLHSQWEAALLENLKPEEIAGHIELLSAEEKKAVKDFIAANKLPTPVDGILVQGVNRALGRFEVRRVSAEELWHAVFPVAEPTTIQELHTRFDDFVATLRGSAAEEKVRIVPAPDEGAE